jgi:epoxyqueuosine reductase
VIHAGDYTDRPFLSGLLMSQLTESELALLVAEIRKTATTLGFQQLGISRPDLERDEPYLQRWLSLKRHGEMAYMQKHGTKRSRPAELVPGTVRVITARMNYLGQTPAAASDSLARQDRAYIARYALGRDYHKVLRQRLKQLADSIRARTRSMAYRVFVDSAPVLEKALARNAGLGWIGKHTNLLSRDAGSWFLLGEIYTDLPLPADAPIGDHCGTCVACIDVCPTAAIVAPYELDARRCISYLTIELKGSIPVEFRQAIGNRIFGCDDCQLICPWNKYARLTGVGDFSPRHGLDAARLTELFAWDEPTWTARTEGSALRRPGYLGWLRNLAIALGNAPTSADVLASLRARAEHPSALVREHVRWALMQHDDV